MYIQALLIIVHSFGNRCNYLFKSNYQIIYNFLAIYYPSLIVISSLDNNNKKNDYLKFKKNI